MALLAVFLVLIFSLFWRIIITNFFHCLFLDGEKFVKKSKIQYDDKEINMVYSLSIMVLQFKSSN